MTLFKRIFGNPRVLAFGLLALMLLAVVGWGQREARAQSVSGLQTAQLSVSSAQLLALNTTPLTVVAAPGAGYSINVVSVDYSLTYLASGGTTYADTGASGLYYGSSSGTLVNPSTTFHTTLINASSLITSGPTAVASAARANLDNQALVLTATANPTTGNGTMQVTVNYTITKD